MLSLGIDPEVRILQKEGSNLAGQSLMMGATLLGEEDTATSARGALGLRKLCVNFPDLPVKAGEKVLIDITRSLQWLNHVEMRRR